MKRNEKKWERKEKEMRKEVEKIMKKNEEEVANDRQIYKYTNAGLKKISGLAAAYSTTSGQTDL